MCQMGQLTTINTKKEDLGVKLSAIENLTNDLEMHSTNKKLGTRWAYQWGAHFCTLAKVDMAILTYGYVYPIGLTKAMRNIDRGIKNGKKTHIWICENCLPFNVKFFLSFGYP